ncbi:MAG: DUF4340 domain-containing protein [Candidatus Hydrogenedentes bacterium]|nr:DUF4340 domain-containing protein [Candidatus Hydrogenedentota bacterium]
MKLRHTFGMLLLLLLLCAVYYGLQYYRIQQQETARVARKVFQFEPEDLRQLTIDRIDEPACKAKCSADGVWKILEPNITITPFQMMWGRVAEKLSQTLNEHTVLSQLTDPAQYGLDIPVLVIAGETKDGDTFQLKFGEIDPTQRSRYAWLNDGDLFLVKTDTYFELNRSLDELRHRFLVNDREAALIEIDFAWIWGGREEDAAGEEKETPKIGEESIAVLVKRDAVDTPWRMTAPKEAPANHHAVQALAAELQYAVCKEFIDTPEDLSDYGLNPARARITVKDADSGEEQILWIGAPDESPDKKGLFVKREHEDAVLVIDPHLVALLPHDPLEWRDKRLLTRRVSDINRLEYTTEFDGFVLEKKDGGAWYLSKPVMDKVNGPAVSGFLSFFKEIEGGKFVKNIDEKTAFATPAAHIKLHFENESTAKILIAAHPATPEEFIALQDSGGIVSLSESAAKMLLTDSENFRSREILRFNNTDVTELAFTFEGVDYHIIRRHKQWILKEPESMQLHNQADVAVLLDAINPLFMTGSVTTETPEEGNIYGLDTPVLDLKITLDNETDAPHTPVTLHIGAPNPANTNERFVQSSTRDGIYRISQEVMDEIREALGGIN